MCENRHIQLPVGNRFDPDVSNARSTKILLRLQCLNKMRKLGIYLKVFERSLELPNSKNCSYLFLLDIFSGFVQPEPAALFILHSVVYQGLHVFCGSQILCRTIKSTQAK